MPRKSPFLISLSDKERETLEGIAIYVTVSRCL
jgi:hypothetical protein